MDISMTPEKISIVTLINHYDIYQDNVIKSTMIEHEKDKIEYIPIFIAPSGSKGLNEGIKKSSNDLIICCHQDVYFQPEWYNTLFNCLELTIKYKKNLGVCGFAGTTDEGKMVGTHSGLEMNDCNVIECQTLDCSLLILRKSIINKYKLKFDEKLRYFHMYGEDISLQCKDKELNVCCLNVPINHDTKWTAGGGFTESLEYIKRKWNHKFSVIYTTVGAYKT